MISIFKYFIIIRCTGPNIIFNSLNNMKYYFMNIIIIAASYNKALSYFIFTIIIKCILKMWKYFNNFLYIIIILCSWKIIFIFIISRRGLLNYLLLLLQHLLHILHVFIWSILLTIKLLGIHIPFIFY